MKIKYHISSLLPVGEMMPNKCNPRIMPNNPDSVQKGVKPQICFSLKYITGYRDKGGIEPPLSSRDIRLVPFIEWLKGQLG